MPTIQFPKWTDLINRSFVPLVHNDDRYLLCWGGRGSSKSDFCAKKLIYRCLTEKYFRYILYRKVYANIKDSQWQQIKDIVEDWGLSSLFTFSQTPLEIRCINGNRFICRGGDEPKKLKSIKDPTGVWYEEEIPDEDHFITITSGIRTAKAKYLQEVFTINPEVEGNFEDHWFYKRFFKDKPDGSFRSKIMVTLPDGKEHIFRYTSHHSTFKDNRWITDSFVAQMLQLKDQNPYYYTIYCLGKWGNRSTGGNFWKHFNRAHHVGPCRYDQTKALHLSFDFNVNPYMTCLIYQIDGNTAYQIGEITASSPNNTTQGVCKEFCARFPGHEAGLFIYGDPAGFHEDTRTQKGHNDYVIIMQELAKYRPTMRVERKHPSIVMSGNWINAIYFNKAGGVNILHDESCTATINDLQFVKEAEDGTMQKAKVKDKDTGITYEKYGHPSDAHRYFMTVAFGQQYTNWMRGDVIKKPILGKSFSKSGY